MFRWMDNRLIVHLSFRRLPDCTTMADNPGTAWQSVDAGSQLRAYSRGRPMLAQQGGGWRIASGRMQSPSQAVHPVCGDVLDQTGAKELQQATAKACREVSAGPSPTLRRGRRMGRPCRSGDVNAMIWCFAIASALLVLNLCFLLRRVRHKVLLVLSVVVVGAPGAIVVGTRERRVGQLAYEFPSSWEDLLVQSLGFTVPALVLCLAVCAVLVGTVPSSHREESESPTCLVCGYSLCGLPTPRCPECGTPFDPVLLGNREKT